MNFPYIAELVSLLVDAPEENNCALEVRGPEGGSITLICPWHLAFARALGGSSIDELEQSVISGASDKSCL